jgi:SnoaL-like domain
MNKIAKTTLAALAFGFGVAVTSLIATHSSAIAQAAGMTSADVIAQMETKAVIDTLFVNVDQKDWKATRSLFTQNVAIDFTSLGGGKATIPSDDLVGAWTKNLYKDKLSLHMTSNHQIKVTGNRAEAYLHGYAHNKLVSATGSDIWQTWGKYRINLERTGAGWKINTLEYFAQHNEGNERARDFVPAN